MFVFQIRIRVCNTLWCHMTGVPRRAPQSIRNVTCERKVNRTTSILVSKCLYFKYLLSECALHFDVTWLGIPAGDSQGIPTKYQILACVLCLQPLTNGSIDHVDDLALISELALARTKIAELSARIVELEEEYSSTQMELGRTQEQNSRLQRDIREVGMLTLYWVLVFHELADSARSVALQKIKKQIVYFLFYFTNFSSILIFFNTPRLYLGTNFDWTVI